MLDPTRRLVSWDKKEMGIGFFKTAASALFIAGVVWGTLRNVPKQQKKNTVAIAENKMGVSLLKKDVTYIRSGIKDIKDLMLHRRNGGRHGQ